MTPNELTELRGRIFHTQREFAELLAELRGANVSVRTVEGWEAGRRERAIPIYLTDVAVIRQATRPIGRQCEQCDDGAVVRKKDLDLCADCAAPYHNGGRG
jgi:hypothetical protein